MFHASCLDGFTAAWVARKAAPNADFIPMNYGDKMPEKIASATGKRILMVDFSMPRADMEFISANNALMVLDHHKTAEENLKGLPYCMFDMNKSGAGMVADFLMEAGTFDQNPEDITNWIWLVNAVEDRDLWNFDLENTREINAALGMNDFKFEQWDEFVKRGSAQAIIEGTIILKYQARIIRYHIAKARDYDIKGYLVPTVNCSDKSIISELLNQLAIGRPFAAGWCVEKDGTLSWSLRSDKDGLDVSEVAKACGGGGHPHAAGFMTKTLKATGFNNEEVEVAARFDG